MKILYHRRTRSKDGQYVHIEEMITALQELGHEIVNKVIELIAHDVPVSARHLLIVGKGPASKGPEAKAKALDVQHRVAITGKQFTWVANARRMVALFERLVPMTPVLTRSLRRGDA